MAASISTAAQAQPHAPVALDSAVYVERVGNGNNRSLEPATRLNRGDRVVTIVTWKRLGGTSNSGGFNIVNPLPNSLAYQASARDEEEISADGGRSWGQIGELRVGGRLATPEDVTHIRWRVAPRSAAAGSGRIAYSGIVR